MVDLVVSSYDTASNGQYQSHNPGSIESYRILGSPLTSVRISSGPWKLRSTLSVTLAIGSHQYSWRKGEGFE